MEKDPAIKSQDDSVLEFKDAAESIGIRTTDTDHWDDVFHAIMAEKIEPHLGMETPCILYDYPASMGALARKKPGDERWVERFELYICGVELANAYSELADAAARVASAEPFSVCRYSGLPPAVRRKRRPARRDWKSPYVEIELTSSHRLTPGDHTSRSYVLRAANPVSPDDRIATR